MAGSKVASEVGNSQQIEGAEDDLRKCLTVNIMACGII